MAELLTIGFKDINGISATTKFWCNTAIEAALALQNAANLSNAQIVYAGLTKPLDLTAVAANVASNANVETAKTKLVLSLFGPDAGSVARKEAKCFLRIPAPDGTLLNGNVFDAARLNPLIPLILSHTGVAMTGIRKVRYEK